MEWPVFLGSGGCHYNNIGVLDDTATSVFLWWDYDQYSWVLANDIIDVLDENTTSVPKFWLTLANDNIDVSDETTAGVPEFWLTIFKNVDLLSDMIQDHDEAILKHLKDLKVKFSISNPMVSFTYTYF